MEGIFLYKKRYVYYPGTNTLINSEIKDLYENSGLYRQKVSLRDVPVDKETILANLTHLNQLVIEISQGCSLRCRYCLFASGEYFFARKPSALTIDYNTAVSAIDYIYGFIRDRKKKEFSLGMYGGEPLCSFETARKIAEYAKKKFHDWNLLLAITTNATLLNEDIIDFLIKYNFKILISLDGPAENHDAKRVFPDGSGSFAAVMENLKKIKAADPVYYQNRVSFSIVYSKDLSMKKMYRFFNQDDLVKENPSMLGFVNETDTTYYDHYPYDPSRVVREWRDIFTKILRKTRVNKELSLIDKNVIIPHSLLKKTLNTDNFNVLSGTCYYDNRIFLSVDGTFHFCEKVNDRYPFGSVEKGFDYPRMMEIMNEYKGVIKKYCSACAFRFLCRHCIANAARGGHLDLAPEFCDNAKHSIKKMMVELIRLSEAEEITKSNQ